MPRYEVIGKSKVSKRRRKRIYSAINEQEARQLAESDDTFIDGAFIEEIVELPPEPPTERQLDYARDLGIQIPDGATKNDLSVMISMKVDQDNPATDRHKSFAKKYAVEVSQFIGKKALFDCIQAALITTGREKELVSWFVYRVYRELVKGNNSAPVEGPDDPIVQDIVSQICNDEAIVKSIRRYRGRDLIWFGEWTAPSGRVYKGGSNRTVAYKTISSLLREKIDISSHRVEGIDRRRNEVKQNMSGSNTQTRQSQSEGCLAGMILSFLAIVGVVVEIVWLLKRFIA